MKDFIKFVTASCLGIFLSMAFLFLFFMVLGIASAPGKSTVKSNTVLNLNLNGLIPEQSENISFGFMDDQPESSPGIHKLVKGLRAAKESSKIKGIVIKNSIAGGGIVKTTLLRDAITDFKESGKFVYTYSDGLDQGSYYLASSSDSIFLNPNGVVDIRGFAINGTFYKKAAEKLGVKLNTFYYGKYKGASEAYRRTNFSEENKYQLSEYLGDLKESFFNDMAADRNLSYEKFDQIAEEYLAFNADSAINLKLVDALAFESEFDDFLKAKLGIDQDESLNMTSMSDFLGMTKLPSSGKSSNKIAVIFAEGEIHNAGDTKGVITLDRYQKSFDDIRNNKNIDGVILRVNSPGGSAFESDIFLHEIGRLQQAGKFVAVSMGDYAASGGYYIACKADTIVANPLTLTGSIGVVSMIPELTELMNDKLGVTFDVVKTNKYADGLSITSPMSEGLKKRYQQGTNEVYYKFVNKVAEGRDMTFDQVDQIAQGRVWSGQDAIEIGLVDELGTLNDAIDIVAERLDYEDYQLMYYPKIKVDPYEQLFKQIMNARNTIAPVPKSIKSLEKQTDFLKWYEQMTKMADGQPKMYLPYRLEF